MLDEIEVNTGFVWIVSKISCVLLATGLYGWWLFGAAAILWWLIKGHINGQTVFSSSCEGDR
jgi:hypothetical protein